MSSIPRFYICGNLNFSGISIGHGDVFPEIRGYHQQDLMDDEVLVRLQKFRGARDGYPNIT